MDITDSPSTSFDQEDTTMDTDLSLEPSKPCPSETSSNQSIDLCPIPIGTTEQQLQDLLDQASLKVSLWTLVSMKEHVFRVCSSQKCFSSAQQTLLVNVRNRCK